MGRKGSDDGCLGIEPVVFAVAIIMDVFGILCELGRSADHMRILRKGSTGSKLIPRRINTVFVHVAFADFADERIAGYCKNFSPITDSSFGTVVVAGEAILIPAAFFINIV